MSAPSEKSYSAIRDVQRLLALALVFRVLFLLAMPRVLDTADAIHYIETANHFSMGDFFGFDPKIPVLYPSLGALVHLVVTDMEWALRVVSFIASVLLVVPVYFLARELHGVAAARVAGITVGIWTWLADYGCRVATEATATLWWFSGVWVLALAVRQGGRFVWFAPLPFIALYLTRPEGLFIMLAAPVFALLLVGKPDKAIAQRLAPFVGFGAMAIILNTLLMRQVTGAATANYRIGFILEDFDFASFGYTALSTLTDVFPVMLGPVLLLFFGVGLFHPRSTPRDMRIGRFVFAFVLLQWVVSLFVLSPAPRYLMSPLIAVSMWSASGITFSAGKLAGLPRGKWLRMLPLGAVVVTMMANAVVTVGSEHLGRRPREPREYKQAGLWMKENLEVGLIFSRKPQIGYYAGMRSTGPALDDTLAEAVARAVAAEAWYFVVDERYSTEAFLPLLERENAPLSLGFLQDFDGVPRARVVVYEILAQEAAALE